MSKAVLIAGATASGKSSLALHLASLLDGEVINADSMQVYKDLNVLTARPGGGEQGAIAHHLYGHVDGGENYSVGRWLEDVKEVLADIAMRGKVAVIVGGTGLYLTALTRGLADVPKMPPKVRDEIRARAALLSSDDLYAELIEQDPEMAAKLAATDRQRVLRALEVIEGTGQSLLHWRNAPHHPLLPPAQWTGLVLHVTRQVLYRRCEARFEAMMEAGALDEVRSLMARQLDPGLPVMKSLGVPDLMAHLKGEIDLETAIRQAKTHTRRFAKRQLTWLNRYMIAWNMVNEQELERESAKILSFIDKKT